MPDQILIDRFCHATNRHMKPGGRRYRPGRVWSDRTLHLTGAHLANAAIEQRTDSFGPGLPGRLI